MPLCDAPDGGPTELYVRPFPAPGGKWQISSGGAGHPRWSADGRHLFWVRWDQKSLPFIMVADCTVKGDVFVASKPHPWSPTPILAYSGAFNYDVAPDGKRLVVFPMSESKGEKGSPHAMFLLNFSDESERKAAGGK